VLLSLLLAAAAAATAAATAAAAIVHIYIYRCPSSPTEGPGSHPEPTAREVSDLLV
jgi:hypothetical protein